MHDHRPAATAADPAEAEASPAAAPAVTQVGAGVFQPLPSWLKPPGLRHVERDWLGRARETEIPYEEVVRQNRARGPRRVAEA